MSGKRLALFAAVTLTLIGCQPTPRDACVVPIPDPPQTQDQINNAFGDQAARIGSWINLRVEYDNCLKEQAYLTRRLSEPMEDVAHAISAKCAPQFELWHHAEAGSYEVMNDTLRSFLDDEKEEDQKTADHAILASVLSYRTCAAGQKPAAKT